MAEKKMTKAVAFAIAAEAMASINPEVAAILAHEVEQIEKKNHAPKKMTAIQMANAELAETILATMVPGTRYLANEVGKLVGVDSNQKISAVLNGMVKAGSLVKETGKKSYFSIPEAE